MGMKRRLEGLPGQFSWKSAAIFYKAGECLNARLEDSASCLLFEHSRAVKKTLTDFSL